MRQLGKVLVATALQFGAAHAALIPLDSEYGPATVVRDTESGLDWLKLTVVDGLTYNDTLRATQPGGYLTGFQIASFEQVHCTLINPNLGLPACSQPAYNRVNYQAAVSFRTLFGGGSLSARYEPFTLDLPEPFQQSWIVSVYAYGDLTADVDSQIVNLRPEQPTRFFLVRQGGQAVPEPAGIALLGVGALMLCAARVARHSRGYLETT